MSISVKEAAKAMGVTEQFIRMGCRQQVLPFGYAVKMPGGRYRYFINEIEFRNFRKETK